MAQTGRHFLKIDKGRPIRIKGTNVIAPIKDKTGKTFSETQAAPRKKRAMTTQNKIITAMPTTKPPRAFNFSFISLVWIAKLQKKIGVGSHPSSSACGRILFSSGLIGCACFLFQSSKESCNALGLFHQHTKPHTPNRVTKRNPGKKYPSLRSDQTTIGAPPNEAIQKNPQKTFSRTSFAPSMRAFSMLNSVRNCCSFILHGSLCFDRYSYSA